MPADEGRWVYIRAVDQDGQAIPGVIPIATRLPNAFDQPVAYGQPTDAQGQSAVLIPNSLHAFVRAWDEDLGQFANNFYEILANSEPVEGVMEVTMLPAARLTASIRAQDGTPASNETVAVSFAHPTRGVWWPWEGKTGDDGSLRIESVPAGKYLIQFKSATQGTLELPETVLLPGQTTELGGLTLIAPQ